jgi:hypothetical protein
MILKLRDPHAPALSDAWIFIDGIRRLRVETISVVRDPDLYCAGNTPQIPDGKLLMHPIEDSDPRGAGNPKFPPLTHTLHECSPEAMLFVDDDEYAFYHAILTLDTEEKELYFTSEGYLMNDMGKTIQKYQAMSQPAPFAVQESAKVN